MTTNNTGALFHQDLTYPYPTLERGQGIYLWDDTGKRYIDGGAGATNVTLGHGRRRIVDAMADQGAKLAFCFSAHFTHQPALDLASRVAALAPGDLNHVYFVSGGSEGIEVAFKIARQFHLQRGNQSKHLVIGRWGSYHGATLGALSATGLPPLRKALCAPAVCLSPHRSLLSLPVFPARLPGSVQFGLRPPTGRSHPAGRTGERGRLRGRTHRAGQHRRGPTAARVLPAHPGDLRPLRGALHRR